MTTVNDQMTGNPSLEVNLQDGPLKEILGDRVPVKTPEGGIVEPTLLLNGSEFFEIDIRRLNNRQFVRVVNLYSSASDFFRENFNQEAIALLPAAWFRGVA